MAESLFDDLPPPSLSSNPKTLQEHLGEEEHHISEPVPAKCRYLTILLLFNPSKTPNAPGETKLRFKMTTDASDAQVIDALQKIASHIKNLTKFAKESKLAIQLIESGAVKSETSDQFFAILEAAMSSSTSCNDISVGRIITRSLRLHDLHSVLNKKQKNKLATWTIRAMTCNDFFTDVSFVWGDVEGFHSGRVRCGTWLKPIKRPSHAIGPMGLFSANKPSFLTAAAQNCVLKILRVLPALFSKVAGRKKEAISSLPVATEDDDK
ncbi:hypothetical protein RJ641_020478 [Dillenia turbinata]|uniref:Uncharacterized protein n=1 Tax=Dillenia turbinata TaxID=194707 RepID=A0AAN8YW85_9MAGN